MNSINNIPYYAVIGLIVSMDVMALTIAKKTTYSDGRQALIGWAALNATWHGGLLVLYVFFFQYAVEFFEWLLNAIDFLIRYLPSFLVPEQFIWFVAKLRLHVFSMFAALAITLVWVTYSAKILDTPLQPGVERLPFWLRPIFRLLRGRAENGASHIFSVNLQAALVAVDMLALAALIKASDQTASVEDKAMMTFIVAISVFLLTLGSAAFARRKFAGDPLPADGDDEPASSQGRAAAKLWILVTLRLVEPLLIFYFLIQLLANMATGIQIDSPALLFAAVLMVGAIVQMHGLARICDAVQLSE